MNERHYRYIKDGMDIHYYIMLPDNYDINKKYPLIVNLHGAGTYGIKPEDMPIDSPEMKYYRLRKPECVMLVPLSSFETWSSQQRNLKHLIDVVIDKAWDNTYSNVKFDVKDVLREAFKMTTYQIHKAKNSGDLKIYIDEVSEEEPSYTSDVPGYWLDAEGKSVGWGETSLVFACLGSNETELWLYAGNHPDSCVPNTTVTTKYLICCNGGMVTANITVNVGDAAE